MAEIKSSLFVFATALALLSACASNPPTPTPEYTPYQPQTLDGWIRQTEQDAIADGVSPATAHLALDGFTPNPRVAELDVRQPETTISFAAYRRNTVTPSRIARGADLLHRYGDILSGIEIRTGVPPQIVVALWGIESSYGQNMGGFDTINSLATLAYQGRRAAFFHGELLAALHILDRGQMPADGLTGSWAGAMGQCQFMPTTYLKYAVDGDGDGRIDIWNDPVDALASIANYLAAEGWRRGQGWGREVNLSDSVIDPGEIGLDQARTMQEWAQQGVTGADGEPLSQAGSPASLLRPDGTDGAAFLAYDNIRALMRWNHSTYFALSVGLLANQIKAY